MQYLSPFKLFGIEIESINKSPNSINAGFLRKKMLAEFELSNSVTIQTPVGELSKNDFLIVLDQLQDTNVLHYHQEIAKDKVLLDFLELNSLEGTISSNPLYFEEGFLRFISPYFAHAYCTLVNAMIENYGSSNPQLLKFPLLLTQGEELTWLQPIQRKISSLISEIENLTIQLKDRYYEKVDEIHHKVYGHHVLRVLNSLNYKIFEHDIEAYVKASLDLIRACINKTNDGFRNEELVVFVLKRIETLRLTPDDAKRIKQFLRAISSKNAPVGETKGRSSVSGFSAIIFIVIAIIRIGLMSNNNSSRSWNYPKPSYESYQVNNGPLFQKVYQEHAQSKSVEISEVNENTDSSKYRNIFNEFKYSYLTYMAKINDLKDTGSVSYRQFKTGENPFNSLESINIKLLGKKHFINFINRSDENLLVILNSADGNSYSFLNKNDSLFIGIKACEANVFFMAGNRWNAAKAVKRYVFSGKNEGEYFVGAFDKCPLNDFYSETQIKFINQLKRSKGLQKKYIPSFTFYSKGDSIKKIEYLPHKIFDNNGIAFIQ